MRCCKVRMLLLLLGRGIVYIACTQLSMWFLKWHFRITSLCLFIVLLKCVLIVIMKFLSLLLDIVLRSWDTSTSLLVWSIILSFISYGNLAILRHSHKFLIQTQAFGSNSVHGLRLIGDNIQIVVGRWDIIFVVVKWLIQILILRNSIQIWLMLLIVKVHERFVYLKVCYLLRRR